MHVSCAPIRLLFPSLHEKINNGLGPEKKKQIATSIWLGRRLLNANAGRREKSEHISNLPFFFYFAVSGMGNIFRVERKGNPDCNLCHSRAGRGKGEFPHFEFGNWMRGRKVTKLPPFTLPRVFRLNQCYFTFFRGLGGGER